MLSSLLAVRLTVPVSLLLLTGACASAPSLVTTPIAPPEVTWAQKLGWMMRLEDQRLLRDVPAVAPTDVAPATRDLAAVPASSPPSDLVRLLADPEGRVRRRAALAAGRTGLPTAVDGVAALLSDAEVDVRQMAAFALGLLAYPSARGALVVALADAQPVVQGRAAEALAAIGDKADAPAIAAMVRAHVQAGAVTGIDTDDLTYPLAPPVEAVRLGLAALARLGAYDALAQAVLGADGAPVSRWWPVASALQRVGDPRAAPALVTLLTGGGTYAPMFAARGLASLKASSAVGPLMAIVQARTAPAGVVRQSVNALAVIGDERAAPLLFALARDVTADIDLREDAFGALGAVHPVGAVDALLDLLSERAPLVRSAAFQALARLDADMFLTALSGLDLDASWEVRVGLATALSGLPSAQAAPLLTRLLMDADPRVVVVALGALAKVRAPDAERQLVERLRVDDIGLRAAAAAGLATLKARGAVPALIEGYRTRTTEASYVPRAAALAALAAIDPQAAVPVLREALADRDWAVRVRAAELLRAAGVADVTADAIRPAPSGRAVSDTEWQWLLAPPYSPHAFLDTDRGTIEIELAVLDAPQTVANFMALARRGFFTNLPVHRVVLDFVVQGGDPRGDGEGGPGYTVRDEINDRPFLRGTVGMALDWRDTGGSQFFITHAPQPQLDGRYTVFGQVVSGMDVVDRLRRGDVIRQVTIRDGVAEP